ncbi:MAG: hypothetical protein AAGA31_11495, partial [Bacteroidota bacterium]
VADTFMLKTSEANVKVYIRQESNDDLSVRVTTTANVKVSDVRAVLDYAEAYPEWVHRCKEAFILPGGTASEYTYCSRVKLPFPFQDREVVASIAQSIDHSTGVLARKISCTPDKLPPTKGYNRETVYESLWLVTPNEGGGVHLSCTVRTAAGSGLPKWLREEIMTGGPVKTIKNLVARLEGR